MKAEVKYYVEVPNVTIKTLSAFLDDILDLNVSENAEVRIDFGLEPGTMRMTVIDVEED